MRQETMTLAELARRGGYRSLRDAAQHAGVRYQTLWQMSRGYRPGIKTLRRLAEALGCSMAELRRAIREGSG